MTKNSSLGDRVRHLRHQKGWTLDQLAGEADVSKGFISAVENGRNQPSGRVLMRLAKALGASVDHLMEGEAGLAECRVASSELQESRGVTIPEDLAEVAESENWRFTKVVAVLNARRAVLAKRSDGPKRQFTKAEWREFAELLAPYLDSVEDGD